MVKNKLPLCFTVYMFGCVCVWGGFLQYLTLLVGNDVRRV